MTLYTIQIRYSLHDGESSSSNTLVIKRISNNASTAISTVSALFGSLSNYTDDLGNKNIEITNVSVVSSTPLESNN